MADSWGLQTSSDFDLMKVSYGTFGTQLAVRETVPMRGRYGRW